jgi:hypothetical protein
LRAQIHTIDGRIRLMQNKGSNRGPKTQLQHQTRKDTPLSDVELSQRPRSARALPELGFISQTAE